MTLTDFDPDGEDKLLAAALYPYTDLPEPQLLERVRRLGTDEKLAVLRAYVGERTNRRHKPGRAFERTDYRFDVLSDYGAFRDLQRHRLLTIEWQPLTTRHGYVRPEADRRGRRHRRLRRRHGPLGRALRRPGATASRTRPPTPCRWRTGSAT